MQILDRFEKSLNPVMNPNLKIEKEINENAELCAREQRAALAAGGPRCWASIAYAGPARPPAQHRSAACAAPPVRTARPPALPGHAVACTAPLGQQLRASAARPPAQLSPRCAAPPLRLRGAARVHKRLPCQRKK
jgi:hypothetical protein